MLFIKFGLYEVRICFYNLVLLCFLVILLCFLVIYQVTVIFFLFILLFSKHALHLIKSNSKDIYKDFYSK